MTIPSQHGASGVTVRYNVTPLSSAGTVLCIERPLSYTHTIATDGGFKTASLSFAANELILSDWLEYGLMRFVTIQNWKGDQCWQGFVNQVDITDGPLKISLGPVLDIQNRVALTYSPVDTIRVPPGSGALVTTGWSNDTASQALYGILQQIEGTSDITAASAARTLANWIAQYAWPTRRMEFSNMSGGQPQVSLSLAGFSSLLGTYYYVDSTSTGTQNMSAKMAAILDADPNALLSSANASIEANTIAVPNNDDLGRKADTVIRELVSVGDATDRRYVWGVYEDHKFVYSLAPTTLEYVGYHNLQNMRIQWTTGQPVEPWDMRPGHWIIFPDTLAAKAWPTANFNRDVRCSFVEEVTYTAPYSVSISGGQVYRTAQRLARLGLASR